MSRLQVLPYVNMVLSTLTNSQKTTLTGLINGSQSTPIIRSLIDASKNISTDDKGVKYLSLETKSGTFTGYLVYNDSYCTLFSYSRNTLQSMSILEIDVAKRTFHLVHEYLDINGFRTVLHLLLKADLVDGRVPSSQLPSYVDDIVEYPTYSDFPEEGESGKIYIDASTNKSYRWTGTQYVQVGGGKPIEEITYSDLVALRTAGELEPGMQYRIIDFVTTTNTSASYHSVGHQFDIIVTADTPSSLNEVARACRHPEDTYFQHANLSAWELLYCLDNDSTRFEWADSVNGKGVIYWMRDEFGNEVGYDFKNIVYDQTGYVRCMTVSQFETNYYRNSDNDREINGTQYYGYTSTTSGPPYEHDVLFLQETPAIGSTMYDLSGNILTTDTYYYVESVVETFSNRYTFHRLPDNSDGSTRIQATSYVAYDNHIGRTMSSTIQSPSNLRKQVLNATCFLQSGSNLPMRNRIAEGSYNNTFKSSPVHDNDFGYGLEGNNIKGTLSFNKIGSNFKDNYINDTIANCIFGNDCHDNVLYGSWSRCHVGNGFSYNSISDLSYHATTIVNCVFSEGVSYLNIPKAKRNINALIVDAETSFLKIEFDSQLSGSGNLQYVHVHTMKGYSSLNMKTISIISADLGLTYSKDYYATNSTEVFI